MKFILMTNIILFLFVLSIFSFINSYLIYPFVVWIIAKVLSSNEEEKKDFEPKLSILIAAFNEEKVIEKRIRNILEQDYDLEKVEILVGSDNSTDRTNEILQKLSDEFPNLKIFLFDIRQGKAGVINQISEKASHEILVFTDANTEFKNNALRNLVKHFAESEIGGVSGKLTLLDKETHKREGVEEKNYWEFETFIKKAEGKLGILIGANGGIFAIRRELFEKIPIDKAVTDDFYISLNVVKKGFKLIYEPEAEAYEEVAKDIETEFKRKVRFAATNFQTIAFFKSLLFNRNILISYAFWSHKVIRWFLPVILILLLILNAMLISENKIFEYLFYFQVFIYVLGLIGYLLSKLKIRIPLVSLLTYFLITNFALLLGLFRFLQKRHSVIWQSTPR